jgi:hypothetical protein
VSEFRTLAKLSGFDFGIEDHGFPYLFGTFEYEDGEARGFGYSIEVGFLLRFMGVFGVDRLQRVNGRSCWVVSRDELRIGYSSEKIIRIDPLHKKDGTPFDLVAWREWVKKYPVSAHELRTGIDPKRGAS